MKNLRRNFRKMLIIATIVAIFFGTTWQGLRIIGAQYRIWAYNQKSEAYEDARAEHQEAALNSVPVRAEYEQDVADSFSELDEKVQAKRSAFIEKMKAGDVVSRFAVALEGDWRIALIGVVMTTLGVIISLFVLRFRRQVIRGEELVLSAVLLTVLAIIRLLHRLSVFLYRYISKALRRAILYLRDDRDRLDRRRRRNIRRAS